MNAKYFLIPIPPLFLIFSQTFLNALLPPINLIDPITITIIILFLYKGMKEMTIISVFILGIIKDYEMYTPFPFHTVTYILVLLIVYMIKNTLLTHENRLAVFLFIFIFSFLYFLFIFIFEQGFIRKATEELVFGVILNSIIAATFWGILFLIEQEIHRRFIQKTSL